MSRSPSPSRNVSSSELSFATALCRRAGRQEAINNLLCPWLVRVGKSKQDCLATYDVQAMLKQLVDG